MAIRGISRGDFIASLRLLGGNSHFILSLLSVVIGLAAGLAAVAFRFLIDLVQQISFGFGGERVASLAAELPWWQVLIVPALGGLVVGLFVYRFLPGRRPHGVAQVIEANALKGGRMSLPVGVNAALASAVSIGAGASVGREGPVVHLGASIGAWLAERLHLGRGQSRMLLGCGVAAAVACSFNAPIAGTFFALEVVVGHYALSAFAPIVIASVTGTLISRAVYGDFPAFILPHNWVVASVWEFPAITGGQPQFTEAWWLDDADTAIFGALAGGDGGGGDTGMGTFTDGSTDFALRLHAIPEPQTATLALLSAARVALR